MAVSINMSYEVFCRGIADYLRANFSDIQKRISGYAYPLTQGTKPAGVVKSQRFHVQICGH